MTEPTTEPTTIEAEVVEEMTQALEVHRPQLPSTLLEGSSPRAQLAHAQEIAQALADIIEKQRLFVQIGKKKYVIVEGWTMLGSILGVFPVTEWTRQTEDGGWEARVVARTLSGAEVGAAETMCSRRESHWKNADDYAIRSMAQTRATGKALRMPLGFVMTLAGYEATPEEEIPREPTHDTPTGGPKPLVAPSSWPKLEQAIGQYDEQTRNLFFRFAAAAREFEFAGKKNDDLTKEEKKQLLGLAARAVVALYNGHDPELFPPPTVDEIRAAWASVLEGQELALPDENTDA